MRRLSLLLPLVLVASLASAVAAELPPLIDRELFFGDPEISGAQLSPDGKYISFIKPYQGVRNIYVKLREEPFEEAQPVTADKRPVTGYFWSRDSKYVLYVQDKGGNENFHVYARGSARPRRGRHRRAAGARPDAARERARHRSTPCPRRRPTSSWSASTTATPRITTSTR